MALVAVVALAKLTAFGVGGSRAVWGAILLLWAVGAVWAGVGHARAGGYTGNLLGILGLQNLLIQAAIAGPALVAGILRLAASGEQDSVFWGNALLSFIAVPALSAVVLSFLGMLLAVPAFRLAGGRG